MAWRVFWRLLTEGVPSQITFTREQRLGHQWISAEFSLLPPEYRQVPPPAMLQGPAQIPVGEGWDEKGWEIVRDWIRSPEGRGRLVVAAQRGFHRRVDEPDQRKVARDLEEFLVKLQALEKAALYGGLGASPAMPPGYYSLQAEAVRQLEEVQRLIKPPLTLWDRVASEDQEG